MGPNPGSQLGCWLYGWLRSARVGSAEHRTLVILLVILVLGFSQTVIVQGGEVRTVFCPIISEAEEPAVDGVVGEKEWGRSVVIDAFIPHPINVPSFYDELHGTAGASAAQWEPLPAAPRGEDKDTLARLMADSERLYVAFVCGGPDGKPKHPNERERDQVSTADDSVEVTLDLDHNHRDYMVFHVGYYGVQTDMARYAGRRDKGWDASWESAVRRGESSWSVEMAIPVKELTGKGIETGRTFGIQLIRYRPCLASRSYLVMGTALSYPDLVFGPPGVVVSQIALPSWKQGSNRVRLKLENRGSASETVIVSARTASTAAEKEWEAKSLSIGGNGEAEVVVAGHVLGDWENRFDLKLSRTAGGEQVYSAKYHFSPGGAVDEEGHQWSVKTSGVICFQPEPFSVEVTEGKGVLRNRMLQTTAELKSRDSGEVIREQKYGPSPGGYVHARADTSGLSDGRYALRVVIADGDGKELLETFHEFVCVADEFGGVKAALSELSRATEVGEFRGAVFDEGAESLDFARSSFLFMEYLVQEAGRQIGAGTIGNYRGKLASAQQLLHEAKKLSNAFKNGEDPLEGRTGVIQRAFVSPYDKQLCPYAVFVPNGYDGIEPLPMVVDLLAEGPAPDWKLGVGEERRRPWESVVASLEKRRFIMAWPRPTRRMKAEVNFFALLGEMEKDYNIDPERIYLMGASGGGLRSWLMGLHYPDQIAAIAPISGLTICTEATEKPWIKSRGIVEELSAYYFPMNALHVPVIVLHGDADPVTRADIQARPMVAKMRELGLDVEYVEYPRGIHTLLEHYEDAFEEAMDYFDRHRNVRHPKRIDFTTPSLRYNRAYWIRIGKLARKGEFARVRAEAIGNTVEVKMENVAGFTLLPDAQVLDVSTPVKVIVDGQETFEGLLPETGGLGFVRTQKGVWQAK